MSFNIRVPNVDYLVHDLIDCIQRGNKVVKRLGRLKFIMVGFMDYISKDTYVEGLRVLENGTKGYEELTQVPSGQEIENWIEENGICGNEQVLKMMTADSPSEDIKNYIKSDVTKHMNKDSFLYVQRC